MKTGAWRCLLLLTAVMYGPLASAYQLSGNVAVANDYIDRGVSLGVDGAAAAVSGGVDLVTEPGWYAGVWMSNSRDFTEVNYYGGLSRETQGGWRWDAGLAIYNFPQRAERGRNIDSQELYAALSRGPVLGRIWYDPTLETMYLEANYRHLLRDELFLQLHGGYLESWKRSSGPDIFDVGVFLDKRGFRIGVWHSDVDDANPRFLISHEWVFDL